jgi:hypothetical protein
MMTGGNEGDNCTKVLVNGGDERKGGPTGRYQSAGYQAILHLRTDHAVGDVILVDGVDPDHTPGEPARRLRGLFAAAAIGGRHAE